MDITTERTKSDCRRHQQQIISGFHPGGRYLGEELPATARKKRTTIPVDEISVTNPSSSAEIIVY